MFKQISVWLPNNPGVLSRFCDVLIKHNIEIRAVTVAENEEYGLLLLLVDKPDECVEILDENGLDIPLSRTNERNHHIVSILVQDLRILEFKMIDFDLRDEPENFEIYDIKWTNSGTQKDKNNTYKKVPKVI